MAQYLFNSCEYLESVFASFKVSMVPVNTNYRYTGAELAYLWENADVEAVVFHGDLADRCEGATPGVFPGVRLWLWVDAGVGDCPAWAVPYEQAAAGADRRVVAPGGRSGDDLFLLYTGGTTGHPKGVMWPQDTLFRMLEELNGRTPAEVADPAARAARLERPGPRVLPAPPLMHGTAMWFAMPALNQGGCVVTVPDRRFDPARLLDTIVEEGVKGLCIVGDAFARPIADALDAEPGTMEPRRSARGVLQRRDVQRRDEGTHPGPRTQCHDRRQPRHLRVGRPRSHAHRRRRRVADGVVPGRPHDEGRRRPRT